MHPNPAFRQTPQELNLLFARARGFGTLALNGAAGPLISHIPFVLSGDGRHAAFHLVRSNPIARALAEGARDAVLAISGPQGYVSPDWYGSEDQVPTWNYVAVHLRGPVELLPQEGLRAHLDALSARFEADLAPKLPWTADKMTEGAMERMMRQIVPARLTIAQIDSTWKLGQNKPETARLGAADGIEAAGLSPEAATLAALMRATDPA
ncbi:FMN-binding negative transcriptional regulator [Acidimangrovimonas sediminis]|uniref:FMN-binding negative transcriptional regulator n=1 Tax=Acidimangrovimonas sediminis TaxID=2056283 RepID=UPI000C804F8F|nr:FMN-binding negative transcriptional regulator [Acidimangrovimonas sediminis]